MNKIVNLENMSTLIKSGLTTKEFIVKALAYRFTRRHVRTNLPYCLKIENGNAVFLNREYKPLGIEKEECPKYNSLEYKKLLSDYYIEWPLNLNEDVIGQLSWRYKDKNGSYYDKIINGYEVRGNDTLYIWFYADHCMPWCGYKKQYMNIMYKLLNIEFIDIDRLC